MLRRLFLTLLASLSSCGCHAWTMPSPRKKNPFLFAALSPLTNEASVETTTRTMPPPPPWTFQASRIHYTFLAVPTHVAQRYYCPCASSSSAQSSLTLLSVPPGYTLGGVFCVEYTDSPVGPYREVAILSSLVGNLGGIGAWASHIFVNNEQAAQYGQAFWGLPAETVDIVNNNDDDAANKNADSVGFYVDFDENKITWTGWDKAKGDSTTTTTKPMEWFNVSLPSFSGCLPLLTEDESGSNTTSEPRTSPLLRYPLRITQPHDFSLCTTNPTSHIRFALDSSLSSSTSMQQVKEILTSSRPLASINVNNVQLQAGIPVPI